APRPAPCRPPRAAALLRSPRRPPRSRSRRRLGRRGLRTFPSPSAWRARAGLGASRGLAASLLTPGPLPHPARP
ncbi:hypothetical protein P7K49_032703, partial [Saguinus oedipus]